MAQRSLSLETVNWAYDIWWVIVAHIIKLIMHSFQVEVEVHPFHCDSLVSGGWFYYHNECLYNLSLETISVLKDWELGHVAWIALRVI